MTRTLVILAVATVFASVAGADSDTHRERFVGEPAVHPSTAEGRAHGLNVRTYYDPILVEDLRAGRSTFRKGAAMVKELYFDDVARPTSTAPGMASRSAEGSACAPAVTGPVRISCGPRSGRSSEVPA
jgi:hypothetical protein